MPAYRSRTSTHGRNMAGAHALRRATGMKDGDFGKAIIAVVNTWPGTSIRPSPKPVTVTRNLGRNDAKAALDGL